MSTSTDTAAADSTNTLLLLDGHSLAFRAFFAIGPEGFSTSTGQHTNAVYGFFTQLMRLIEDESPTHLAVAFDVSRSSLHRTAEYPEYKATRSAPPPEWEGQIPLIRELLASCGVFTAELEGHEADDIIATLATRAEAQGIKTLISTGDRDSLQLVDDHITVLYPKQGSSSPIRYTPEEVEKKYGVLPARYPELAALRGDNSDNLPGVPKVGDKTAAKWLNQYGDLDQIIAHADEFRGKLGEYLREAIPDVQRNLRLTLLERDLDLDFDLAALRRTTADRAALTAQLDALQFGHGFRDRLFKTFAGAESDKNDDDDDADTDLAVELKVSALGPDEFADWLAANQAPRYAVFLEGNSSPAAPDLKSVAIATEDGAACAFDLTQISPADEDALSAWLADPQASIVVHDSKAARHLLRSRDWTLEGVSADICLAAYLVRPGQRTYELADLTLRHLGRDLHPSGEPEAQMSLLDEAGSDTEFAQYRAESAIALFALDAQLNRELAVVQETKLLAEMELPLARILYDCEAAGIAVDTAALDRLSDRFSEEAGDAERAAWDAIGDDSVNLGSPKQLQKVLFEDLGLPKTKKIKTGYTTDAKALEELNARTGHPFLAALLRHRDVTKKKQMVETLSKAVADDGRIHTTFRQTITTTGRLSSVEPNLQNIPVRTADGRAIRAAFTVGPEYECLMTADYSQIEMRVMAHLSGDEGLIEAFRSGEDLHRYVGSQAFGVAIEDVTPELRRRTKAMSYGLAYGLSAYGLAAQLGISQAEAKDQMEAYFARFGAVRDFLHNVVQKARRDGYTATMFGRRRYLPELTSTNRIQRENAERAALNAPIQGTAADIIKEAMLRVDRRFVAENLASRMLLQVHDELVVEVAPGEQDAVRAALVEEMSEAITLSVPLDVSVGIGSSWDEAGH